MHIHTNPQTNGELYYDCTLKKCKARQSCNFFFISSSRNQFKNIELFYTEANKQTNTYKNIKSFWW